MTDQPTVSEPKPRDRRALNAYRHGLTGQVLIQTPEDQDAYDKHCREIRESLAPAPGIEASLVQSIADGRWRLQRAAAMENSVLSMGTQTPPNIIAGNEEIYTAFAQAIVWLKKDKSLGLLTLYESRIGRRVEKDMQSLRQLQQDRQAAFNKAVEEATLLAQLAASKGETYDIERDFPSEAWNIPLVGWPAIPPQFVFSTTEMARRVAHNRRLAEAKKHLQAPPKAFRQAA